MNKNKTVKSKTGFKVLVPDTKSAPKAPEEEQALSKRGRPKGTKSKSSPTMSPTKTPPRYSSTPKPKSKKAKKQLIGHPQVTKTVAVLLERLTDEDILKYSTPSNRLPTKVTAEKSTRKRQVEKNSVKSALAKSKKPLGRPRKTLKKENVDSTQEDVEGIEEPPRDDVETIVPLENLGLRFEDEGTQSESGEQQVPDIVVTPYTPPPTSACSSKAAGSQRASVSSEGSRLSCLLPDSSEYPPEDLTLPVVGLIFGDNPDLAGVNNPAVFNVSSTSHSQIDPLDTSSQDSDESETPEVLKLFNVILLCALFCPTTSLELSHPV